MSEEDRVKVTLLHGTAWFLDGTVAEYDAGQGAWKVIEDGPSADLCVDLIAKWSVEVRE